MKNFVGDPHFQLSVIVPAYSEKNSLIQNVQKVLKNNDEDILEVIIIVSKNADEGTLIICQELAKIERKVICHIQQNEGGLGFALREAFGLVRGTHVQILYADCESEPEFI